MYGKIVITGSVCTGKTTVADIAARRLGAKAVHITDYVKEHKLYSGMDGDEYVVKMKSLQDALAKMDGVVLESHLLCEFRLPGAIVIVLRCDPRTLEARMKERGYAAQKIKDNAQAEALDYCTINASENYGSGKVYELDATKLTPDGAADEILKIVKGQRKGDSVDFSAYLL